MWFWLDFLFSANSFLFFFLLSTCNCHTSLCQKVFETDFSLWLQKPFFLRNAKKPKFDMEKSNVTTDKTNKCLKELFLPRFIRKSCPLFPRTFNAKNILYFYPYVIWKSRIFTPRFKTVSDYPVLKRLNNISKCYF